jgi:hypothetical protein
MRDHISIPFFRLVLLRPSVSFLSFCVSTNGLRPSACRLFSCLGVCDSLLTRKSCHLQSNERFHSPQKAMERPNFHATVGGTVRKQLGHFSVPKCYMSSKLRNRPEVGGLLSYSTPESGGRAGPPLWRAAQH